MGSVVTQVRLATAQDAVVIAQFNQAMAEETESRALDSDTILGGVRSVFAEPSLGRYYIAEINGAISGCLLITFEWSDWRDGMFWWIQSVYVTPEARRKGVFRALYAAVRSEATIANNVCGLRLYVEQDNTDAQTTYRGLGMHATPYQLFEEEL